MGVPCTGERNQKRSRTFVGWNTVSEDAGQPMKAYGADRLSPSPLVGGGMWPL